MSGPAEPSARRAVKANQSPLGEYAADWPTSTTSLAISIAPGADADGEIVIADAVGGADSVGWIRGLGAGVAEVDAAAVTSGASEGDFEADGGALVAGLSDAVAPALPVALGPGVASPVAVAVGGAGPLIAVLGALLAVGTGVPSAAGGGEASGTTATVEFEPTIRRVPSVEPNTVSGSVVI